MTETTIVEDRPVDIVDVHGEAPQPKRSSSPCMAKLDRLAWATCEWFQIDDFAFGVRTTSPAFAGWVRYVLAGYRIDGPPDPDRDPLFALIVEDDSSVSGRTGKRLHIFYQGTADLVRTMDVRAVARSFLYALETLTFPVRDDAVYLDASVIQGGGKTVLVPWYMVPVLNTVGRQLLKTVDMVLPATMSIALDLETAHLIPARSTLDIPWDALQVLGDHLPVGADEDKRAMVDEELQLDRVVVMASRWVSTLEPTSRGTALYKMAKSIRNLGALGGRGIETVGRLLADTEVLETRWTSSHDVIGIAAAAVNGGCYTPERREPPLEDPEDP